MRYNGIVAKLLEEEANDLGPSKERDIELARVRTIIFYQLVATASVVTPFSKTFKDQIRSKTFERHKSVPCIISAKILGS